ncbi:MAG: hypothetical protein HGA55_00775, partial [Methanoregulaceae archaeon]|nr:hypothetical protein [Methanoregulaceae archaeon]
RRAAECFAVDLGGTVAEDLNRPGRRHEGGGLSEISSEADHSHVARVGLVGIENTFVVTPGGGRSITGSSPGLIPVW